MPDPTDDGETLEQARARLTARERASALSLNLSACAAGIWPATPSLLDALAHLASSTVWDLCIDDMLVAS